MRYKEGFAVDLVERLLDDVRPHSVLDPFSGVGTAPIVASGKGLQATGIEITPVAMLAAKAIVLAANELSSVNFRKTAKHLAQHVRCVGEASLEYAYPHVKITEAAFPSETESAIARAREFISTTEDSSMRTMLNLACLSILESVSYTRKDGQYLRWDHRSGKNTRGQMRKKEIPRFVDALYVRTEQMLEDIDRVKQLYEGNSPDFIEGSSLSRLRKLPNESFDMVMTSPPYANRYDYTRTYALELAWMGYSEDDIKALRQTMLSATVENKSKRQWLTDLYEGEPLLIKAIDMYECQAAVQEALTPLRDSSSELNNPQIVRMIEGYFLEMAVIIAELARIVHPGGVVAMVNDNVQYHGEEIPVDLILSDFAEQCGFTCKYIWTIPRMKGNSSQQMSRFGRRELRKCVYWWVRDG